MYADIGLWDFFCHPNMMEVNGVLFILYFIFESIEIIVPNYLNKIPFQTWTLLQCLLLWKAKRKNK